MFLVKYFWIVTFHFAYTKACFQFGCITSEVTMAHKTTNINTNADQPSSSRYLDVKAN